MSLLVLGGNSLIAKHVAEKFAQNRQDVFFAGRNEEELKKLSSDFKIRYNINAFWDYFDAVDYQKHKTFFDNVLNKMPDLENALIAFGYLGDQEKAENDFDEAKRILEVNLVGVVSVANILVDYLKKRGKGSIIAISSVAGDRGRQSNYVYGAAKGGLSIYLQGLRNRLSNTGVKVITVKAGFVDTPMTYGMDLPKILLSNPDKIASDIYSAFQRDKNIIYTPWFWRPIMLIIKLIPEKIFKKLKL